MCSVAPLRCAKETAILKSDEQTRFSDAPPGVATDA